MSVHKLGTSWPSRDRILGVRSEEWVKPVIKQTQFSPYLITREEKLAAEMRRAFNSIPSSQPANESPSPKTVNRHAGGSF